MRPFSSLAFDAANFWGERKFGVAALRICDFSPPMGIVAEIRRTFDQAQVDRATFGLAKLDFRASPPHRKQEDFHTKNAFQLASLHRGAAVDAAASDPLLTAMAGSVVSHS